MVQVKFLLISLAVASFSAATISDAFINSNNGSTPFVAAINENGDTVISTTNNDDGTTVNITGNAAEALMDIAPELVATDEIEDMSLEKLEELASKIDLIEIEASGSITGVDKRNSFSSTSFVINIVSSFVILIFKTIDIIVKNSSELGKNVPSNIRAAVIAKLLININNFFSALIVALSEWSPSSFSVIGAAQAFIIKTGLGNVISALTSLVVSLIEKDINKDTKLDFLVREQLLVLVEHVGQVIIVLTSKGDSTAKSLDSVAASFEGVAKHFKEYIN
ncbi:hypothetical protein D0Z00_004499 [Geotrichum galactomycetum]|uniref:Uncharacterized protein n=1 Tax=Geotrichum galactomycetum TaxID=27317 RepID=A0ACB6UY96_9ASCO|nr:hypothetical protein D0Z00_004499 [Geotrichum candidum]